MQNIKTTLLTLLLLITLSVTTGAQSRPSDTGSAIETLIRRRIETVPRVETIERLRSDYYADKYLLTFRQPLDHSDPAAGTFTQRVIVCHRGFDRPTVMVTEGYGAQYALYKGYHEELSDLLDANLIFVEHRYFLESTPEPKDWQYLTARNSADDLHQINKAFHTIYNKQWIATGISKGGQTTVLYRTFHPDDVALSVPHVAPLCYDAEDGRHEPFLKQISTPADRHRIEAFQLEILKRRDALMPLFGKYCHEHQLQFNAPLDEVYDMCVLEYSFALWQWGTPLTTIPPTNAPDNTLFTHLMSISSPEYFQKDGPTQSFFVQAARELGYYGYDTTPFKDHLKIKTTKGYLHKYMLPAELRDMPFDKTLSRKITSYLTNNDPAMIFIYGENDPWTAAGVTWLKNKKNIHVFIQPGGSHKARIKTMTDKQQKEIIQLLRQTINF